VRLLDNKRSVPAHSLHWGSCPPARGSLHAAHRGDRSERPSCRTNPEPLPKHLAATAGNAGRDCLGVLQNDWTVSGV